MARSAMNGYVGPEVLSLEIIKTFSFSFLFLLSVNEADPLPGWHGVGQDMHWQVAWIYICLNYDEFFFPPSQYSDHCPTVTLLLSVAQFHGADLVFFSNCKILFKTNELHSLVCLCFVLLPGKTFLEAWIHVTPGGIKSLIFSKMPLVSPHLFPKKQTFFFYDEDNKKMKENIYGMLSL